MSSVLQAPVRNTALLLKLLQKQKESAALITIILNLMEEINHDIKH